MRLLTFACAATTGALLCTSALGVNVVDPKEPPRFRIDPSTGHFMDQHGRTRIFHGVNAVYKAAPWLPSTDEFDPLNSIAEQDIEDLHSWGFNVVRLGVMWPGVEPEPNQYNSTYLEHVNSLVTNLGKNGIYTIGDFHQDLLHPSYCGEGIPDHALNVSDHDCNSGIVPSIAKLFGGCKSFKDWDIPIDPRTGYPSVEACVNVSFSLFYPTPELSSAFENLYTNPSIRSSFIHYWKQVVQTLSINPYVFGYDLFNEPWPGNIWRNVGLLFPGDGDKLHLQGLYQDLHKMIRKIDNSKILLYEGVQFPDVYPILNGIISSNGFTATPGGKQYNDRQALSYHVYCCGSGADACDKNGDPTTKYDAACDKFNPSKMSTRINDAKRVGGGSFMTEFGACTNTDQCRKEIERTTGAADSHFGSWAYWQFKFFNDVTTQSGVAEGFYNEDGTLQLEKVKALSRTYAQAIQGVPVSMSFDPSSAHFKLSYKANKKASAPSVIYTNQEYYYPHGINVVIHPSNAATYSITENRWVSIKHSSKLSDGALISIDITPRASAAIIAIEDVDDKKLD